MAVSTQSTPSSTDLAAYMAKHVDAPKWEQRDTSSVGETLVSEERSVSDERHTPYGVYIARERSRWAFAQKPIRPSAVNEASKWPPPPSSSSSFCFDPFGGSEEQTVGPTHFAPGPIPTSLYVPGKASLALYNPMDTIHIPPPHRPLRSTDATYGGISTNILVDRVVAYPNLVAQPQSLQREPTSAHRQVPPCNLAHSATPAVSRPTTATAPSLYEDEDEEDDFVLHALQLPWLEYTFIDVDEFTPPSTPSSTPPLSPSTLGDDDDDLLVLEKEEELRGWEEASPLARDAIYLAAF
ncbi:unnamed protein product [Somion occarium]|uniref:Uncharacterized protein n=1 Tax=Somion occarium TaxID=3059160 RepID=A0ABP1CUP9_9APHY